MEPSASDSYLSTEVLTATPQKLQLMLLDAAIRFAERARHFWSQAQDDDAAVALNRAQSFVNELVAGLNYEDGGELVRRMAAIYLFIFRNLMEANSGHDEQKLAEAIRVLNIERETWRQVCEKCPAASAPARSAFAPPHYDLGPAFPDADGTPTSGFSLEA
jgi:flagellar secretion chaperone FliS